MMPILTNVLRNGDTFTLPDEDLIAMWGNTPIVRSLDKHEHGEVCPDCGGYGLIVCSCCGHEHDCDNCSGYGYLPTEAEIAQEAEQKRINKLLASRYGTIRPASLRDYWFDEAAP